MKLHTIKERLKHSSDGKVLIENFLSLSMLQAITYIFPFITMPYLAKTLGVDCIGDIAFAASVVAFFETFTVFGFQYTAVRDIAKCKEDINKVSIIFSNVMFAKILLLLVSIVLFIILTISIPLFRNYSLLLWLTFLYLPGHILFPDWFFQAIEKMKYITVLNVLAKTIFTLLIFIVIKRPEDYYLQPLLGAVGYIVSGIISIYVVVAKLGVSIHWTSFKSVWATIRGSFNMFINIFLPNLYTNFSVVIMRMYSTPSATGIYSSGKKFIDLFDNISSVLSRTFYPFLARRIDKHSFYARLSGVFSVLVGGGLFVFADLLVKIFLTNEFAESAKVIRIMSMAPFFLFLMNTYGTNYLVLKGREDVLRNIIIVCSIVGFILTWVVVRNYGYIGAAITVVGVWGVRGLLTWYFAKLNSNAENTHGKKE